MLSEHRRIIADLNMAIEKYDDEIAALIFDMCARIVRKYGMWPSPMYFSSDENEYYFTLAHTLKVYIRDRTNGDWVKMDWGQVWASGFEADIVKVLEREVVSSKLELDRVLTDLEDLEID